VNTVAENKSKYTTRDYSKAVIARKLQTNIGHRSTRDVKTIVTGNQLLNCPMTKDDVTTADDIFGVNAGSLKGKTTYRKGAHVTSDAVNIPVSIMSRYQEVNLCVDLMFVNRIPFFVTISRNIHFGTVEMIRARKKKVIEAALKHVFDLYAKRGFKITHVHGDGKFEPLLGAIAGPGMSAELNTVSWGVHVPDVERYIRTVKERTRCVYNTMLFSCMPARMIIEMVYNAIFWLNAFPPADGVSKTEIPRAIIVRQRVDYLKHCQLEFGEYAQVHEYSMCSSVKSCSTVFLFRAEYASQSKVQGKYY
jgi:hypothetical protein